MTTKDVSLEKTCVMTEYIIDNGKRIDIMLQSPAFSVPIEAKIKDREQESQCYDYLPYTRKAKLVYLTKDVRMPSRWSRQSKDGSDELKEDQINCISWRQIFDWLEQEPSAPEQVRQYAKAIQSFLSESKYNAPDCDLAYKVLEAYKGEMVRRKLTEIYGLEEPEIRYGSYLDWSKQNFSGCPGLNYRAKDAKFSGGLQMWFRIEIAGDGYLSSGFCLMDTEVEQKVRVGDDAIKVVQNIGNLRFILARDDWWFVWRRSNGKQDVSRDDVPNFKTMNQRAANLVDERERKNFVEATVQIFEDQLLGYLK